jgi:hypothetical protein
LEKAFLKKFFYRVCHWETWHYLAKYIPLSPAWLWYCLRARSFWFFTPSNPTLTFGGFEGERKKEMYDQLPQSIYPKTIYISPSLPVSEVEQLLKADNFHYPFAVKPDVGMMGFMFRKIETSSQLTQYHSVIGVDYLIQDLVTYPIELSLFYYRFPGDQRGTITGFLRKDFLEVVGDGRSTLLELMLKYPRVAFRLEEMKSKHKLRLNTVLPVGEVFCLSPALNLSRGGKLVSLEHEKDDNLLNVFDGLSHYTKSFFYGRYDIKCASIEDLKAGKNFSILEYNGCGAEPHHIYGNGNNVFQAYKIVLQHWNVLYKISRQNYERGVKYWKHKEGLRFLKEAKKHFRRLKQLDLETEL